MNGRSLRPRFSIPDLPETVFFLAGSQPDPYHVLLNGIDPIDDFGVTSFQQRSVRRRVSADDLQPGEEAMQPIRELIRNAGLQHKTPPLIHSSLTSDFSVNRCTTSPLKGAHQIGGTSGLQ